MAFLTPEELQTHLYKENIETIAGQLMKSTQESVKLMHMAADVLGEQDESIQQTDALFQEVLAGVEMSSAAVRENRKKMHLTDNLAPAGLSFFYP